MKTTSKVAESIKPGNYILVGQEPFAPFLMVHGIDDGYGVRRFWGKEDSWVIELRNDDIVSVAELGGFVERKPNTGGPK